MRTSTFALLLGLIMCSSTGAYAEPATTEGTDDATTALQLYDRGLERFRARQFDEAAADFEAAFRTEPRLAVLFNLGLAYAAGGQPINAVRALSRYLEATGGSLPAARRQMVNDILESQRQRIGSLTIDAPPGTHFSVDEFFFGETPLSGPIQMSVGMHTVVGRRAGFLTTTRAVRVEPKKLTTLELTLQVAPTTASFPPTAIEAPKPSPPRIGASAGPRTDLQTLAPRRRTSDSTFHALGLGSAAGAIVFAALGTVFALQAHSAEERLNEVAEAGGRWSREYQATESSGQRAQYAEWSCFGSAGVFAGVATWLLITPPRSNDPSDVAIEASQRGLKLQGSLRF